MSGYYPPSGAPPQQFGYPQQHYQQQQPPPPPPPPGGQGWGQQSNSGYPAQYQQPPQQQWMPPPGPPGQQFPPMPPQQGYNHAAPPPPPNVQQFQSPAGYQQPPAPSPQGFPQSMPPQANQPPYAPGSAPSPGYNNEVAQGNANPDVEALMRAMSGFRKDHSTVIHILSKASPQQMALIRQTYAQRNRGASLESKVESSFRSHYGDLLVQLVRGPLLADVWNINRAIKGLGTKEDMLNDVLIGRSNADMRVIKSTYHETFKKTMESDVEGDLSLKTKTMFQLIMRASRTEESYPYNPAEIARDAEALHYATRGPSVATNQETVFTVLTQRSDNQIRAITHEYQKRYNKSLEDTIRSNFTGHMEDALLLCVGRAVDRAKTDAFSLENTMKGLGTKDNQLVNTTVRIHWDRQNMDQVKKAYHHFFKRDLVGRVRGETSGDYRDALVACLT